MTINGAGRDMDAPDPQPPNPFQCDLCMAEFPDVTALTLHLQSEHRLAGVSFNPARDCLDSEATCAHCGKIYSSQESLRSHINQGRCQFFNPAAAPESKTLEAEWVDACLNGQFAQILASPSLRLRLTVNCIHCGQAYQRAGDLSNHIMTAHAKLWRQAQQLTKLLNQLVADCVCNPKIHNRRGNHQCCCLT